MHLGKNLAIFRGPGGLTLGSEELLELLDHIAGAGHLLLRLMRVVEALLEAGDVRANVILLGDRLANFGIERVSSQLELVEVYVEVHQAAQLV